MVSTQNILFAFLLTALAGMATAVGSLIAFLAKNKNTRFLSISLGFSAGVMLYVSFIEIFPKAQESLVTELGDQKGCWVTVLAFFAGMILMALIDRWIPEAENPHDFQKLSVVEGGLKKQNKFAEDQRLMRIGLFSALALAIHNFPEGLATFVAALKDPALGISITIAIAIHNIPEGIAV